MLPALLAQDLRDQILSFLETTFLFREPAVWDGLNAFLTDPQQGLFKGPYLSLELPYRKAEADAASPLTIRPSFLPYAHQAEAWARLASAQAGGPRHTLVTTGTSSGKTECFLYPLVDHCWQQRGRPGIKAIILYPMNALATDQSKRLARILHGDGRLRGVITAGMYVGGQQAGDGSPVMGPDHLITARQALRQHPPDILLTNYKMLDLLLLRPEDRELWQHQQPDTLRYLVVDELHTFDGAQGAEVACLIRRLRSRLGTPDQGLCCVGTSATIAGEGDGGRGRLADFASTIFGLKVNAEAIVGETRLSLSAYLDRCLPHHHDHPLPGADQVVPHPDDSFESYVQRVATAWFGRLPSNADGSFDPVALGRLVQGSELFAPLLRTAVGRIQTLDEVAARLVANHSLPADGPALAVLGSFLALVAESRWQQADGDPFTPILAKSQVQIWIREMSRLGRVLDPKPVFRWLSDETENQPGQKALPPWFCRECGASGWLAVAHDQDSTLTWQREAIYDRYFEHSRHIRYLLPTQVQEGMIPEIATALAGRVCPACGWFGPASLTRQEECPACKTRTLPVQVHRPVCRQDPKNLRDVDTQTCPLCGAGGHLAIVGSQAASLAAIALGHLYAHPLNRQPKLLAFTDSVQDASHRAGFFQARTFRMGLRTAAARMVQATGRQPLADLAHRLLAWWQTQPGQSTASLIANLTPPDLDELPLYAEALSEKAGRSQPEAMLLLLERRLQYELQQEFGLNSRRGRTLEKSSVLHLEADRAALAQAAAGLGRAMAAEIAGLERVGPERWQAWLQAVALKARLSGAIWHPYLEKYAESLGDEFHLVRAAKNRSRFRDELPPLRGRPLFPCSLSNGSDFLPFGVAGYQRQTWLIDFTRRWFGSPLGDHALVEIARRGIQALVQAGWWTAREGTGNTQVWGWDPAALSVVPGGTQVRCQVCNHHLTVGDPAPWLGTTCLTPQCPGQYQPIGDPEQARADFYRKRYLSGTIRRIFAHEHTGLLERGDQVTPGTREWVEHQFLSSGRPEARADALNLLTCTSTLEMGLNIGDLSSTMLCSVPPTTASYLQRIGRAGRSTGAALILSLATSSSHDLHFFSDPLAMMAGAVDTPGCFLDAPEVVARHFLAWCIDALVGAGVITEATWPRQARDLHRQWTGQDGALVTLHQRLAQDQVGWEARFQAAFGSALSEHGWSKLHPLIQASHIHQVLKSAADAYQNRRQEFDERLRVLRRERDELKKVARPDEDTELRQADVAQQIKALELRRSDLGEKNTWSFLTDLGILPNYAFPESGVRLSTEIYFPRPWNRNPERHEWMRGASEALRDLAPGNTFHAQRRRFQITRIEMGPADNPEVTRWRFCSRCRHIEEDRGLPQSTCPECGAVDWQDLGRLRSLHRLNAVASVMDHFQSLADDDSDDRKQERYLVEDFFSIDHASHLHAWAEPELPFGFELLGRVTLRQVNLGQAAHRVATAPIADQDLPAQGYRVCADCGVVEFSSQTQAKHHQLWCLGRRKTENGAEDAWRWHGGEQLPYLYRELSSEALRLLLPSGTLDDRQATASFTAALGLGLRLRFGGNPDHLMIRAQEQPIGDGDCHRTYLLIFDQVPGGTGYLREISRPEVLRDCLERAHRHLLACDCRVQTGAGPDPIDPTPAGCYKCLLSYGVQRDRQHLRREVAVHLLDRILRRWEDLKEQPNRSLGAVPDVSLMASALERRFVSVLGKAVKQAGGAWRDDLVGGKSGFAFSLAGRSWTVEPQVGLGPAHGVAIPSQPDFLIQPVAARPGQLPVAVFLDGYRFHACLSEDGGSRIPDDLAKRQAIRASQRMLVWSLTWKDLDEAAPGAELNPGWFEPERWRELLRVMGGQMATLPDLAGMDGYGLQQLLAYFNHPQVDDWGLALGRYLVFAALSGQNTAEPAFHAAWTAWTDPEGQTPAPAAGDGSWRCLVRPIGPGLASLIGLNLLEWMPAMNGTDPIRLSQQLRVLVHLDDDPALRQDETAFVPIWRRFQAMSNLIQFLPGSVVTSRETNQVRAPLPESTAGPPTSQDSPWALVHHFIQAGYRPLAQHLEQAGMPVPQVGYELLVRGEVVGLAELAWPDQQPPLALVIGGDTADAVAFTDAAWRVIDADHPQAADLVIAALSSPPAP